MMLYHSVLLLAIEFNKKYSKAFMKRARAYEKLNRKEECLQGTVNCSNITRQVIASAASKCVAKFFLIYIVCFQTSSSKHIIYIVHV